MKKKSFHVAVILSVVMFFVIMMFITVGIPFYNGLIFTMMFIALIGINGLFYLKSHWFPEFNFSMYATALGLYLVGIGLILELYHPSLFTIFFLFYAIIAVYQHARTVLINNLLLLISGTLVIFGFPDMFHTGGLSSTTVYIYVFLFIFVMLLSLSSFILTKQKERFYWKIAMIKEREARSISLVFNLGESLNDHQMNYGEYYDALEDFANALSSEIGIENVFKERIDLLKELSLSEDEGGIARDYPDYTAYDLEEVKQMELKRYGKMRYLGFKAAQYHDFEFDEEASLGHIEDITKSLDYSSDSIPVKIVAFSVFIALLRVEKPYLRKLTIEEILAVMNEPDVRYLFDHRLVDFLKEQIETIDKITSFDDGKRE
ncbi:MAG: hypothetical protein ACLFUQ_03130 [Candidatus Izemoplasmataceae bacterium]